MSSKTFQREQLALNKGPFLDLSIIIATLVAVKQALLPFTMLYAGPVSTFVAMIVATFVLRRRGLGWRDLGFRKPEGWLNTIGLTILVFIGIILTSGIGGYVVGLMFEDVGTSGRFDHVEGNLWAYLGVMLLVWTHAAIFEEALFRAFVINRALASLGGGRMAHVIALLFSATFLAIGTIITRA